MEQLINSLLELAFAGWHVVISLLALIVPWTPLILWIAFWLLAVNWEKLYPVMAKGGAICVVLIGLSMILVWGLIAPPADGAHHLMGLNPSNFVGKAIYVTMLLTIMALCGSVQLSGACGSLVHFPEEDESDDHGDHHHGHGGHDEHAHAESSSSHAH